MSDNQAQHAEDVRMPRDVPTYQKGMEDHPNWTCICDHHISEHGQDVNDSVSCGACNCPDFCSAEDADEVTAAIYEWALEDGTTWATTAHEYRRYRRRQSDGQEGGS